MKNILFKTKFAPFSWLDLDHLPSSQGEYFEIYFNEDSDKASLNSLFFQFFQSYANDLIIGQLGSGSKWGDFCLDTWNIETDGFDYSVEEKSRETANYLTLLKKCEIEPEFTGFCGSRDWVSLLNVIIPCVLSGIAPYSPLFYCKEHRFILYFDHSKSIGIRYLEYNFALNGIVRKAMHSGHSIENVSHKHVRQILEG